jgi:hypothetical protein
MDAPRTANAKRSLRTQSSTELKKLRGTVEYWCHRYRYSWVSLVGVESTGVRVGLKNESLGERLRERAKMIEYETHGRAVHDLKRWISIGDRNLWTPYYRRVSMGQPEEIVDLDR